MLALQRSAGNYAVQQAVASASATRLLQREPPKGAKTAPAETKFPIPPGKNFQWYRQGMTFLVSVSKQWLLDRKVAPDSTEIPIPIVTEMVSTIADVAPWVDLPTLNKGVRAMTLDAPLSEVPATIPIRMSEFLAGFVGNPPGQEVVVQPSGDGAVLFVDTGLVRKHLADPAATKVVDSTFSAVLFGALETALKQTMGADREEGFRTTLYRDWEWDLPAPLDQVGRSVNFRLAADDLEGLFGPDWGAKAARGDAKDAGRVKGHGVGLPESLKDDWPKIMAVMKEIVGAPVGPKKKDEPRLSISEKDALLLLKIANSPLRSEIIARLTRTGGGGDKTASLGDVLEAVIEEQELKDARKRLGFGDPGTGGETPVLKRPVHGNIVLTGGRPVPGKEAVFTFEVTDDVDALRAPLIQIQWVVYPKGKPKEIFDDELNTYSPLRGDGPINDKLFEVTFPSAGEYVVEAIVNHNFYLTAHFKSELKVLTEEQEVAFQEKGPLSGFAAPTGAKTEKHTFDDVGSVSSAAGYDEGTITRGKLDPAFNAGTLADRLKAIDAEIVRVDKLFKQYEKRPGDQAAAVRNWAEDYLKTLREGRTKIDADGKDTRMVPCTGVYVSRSKKAPSKALDLICLQKKTADGYTVTLHDLSQVYESENYEFSVDNDTAEGAYEEVFVEAAESYPDGTLSIAFQGWDEKKQEPTGSYVKFRKVTDTVGKDIKTNVFDPAINIAVNIAAAVMMVVPGLQAAGFILAVSWNTSQTLADLEEKAAKGTLKDKDYLYAGASFALDLLPVVGRSARMVSLGRKAFYVIEGVQLSGQALLVTAQGMEQIEKLRNGVIAKLAKLNEKITELERVNPSDPELESMRAQQEKLIKEGEDAVKSVYGSMIAQQAMVMVAGGVLQHAAIKKFGARLGELETTGRFAHRDGEPVRYDFAERKIIGDREKMTQAEFEKAERIAGLSERLEGTVPDPATRARIVESLGDGPVHVVVGGKKTHVQADGDGKVLHVADGARPDEIVTATVKQPATTGTDPDPKKPAPAGDPKPPAPVDTPPAHGLDAAQTKKLHDAVTPDQAQAMHDFLGGDRLRKLVDKKSAAALKGYAEGIERAKAASSDPRAAEGLARMGSKQSEKLGGMAPDTVAEVLSTVPAGRMEIFLRALADPDVPHPRQMGERGLTRLAGSMDELGFITEHGGAAYKDLRGEDAFSPLLERLRGLDPDEAHALVDAVRSARGKQGKLKAVGIEPPVRRPRRATGKIAADKDDPGWQRHLDRATEFAENHRGTTEGGPTPYDPTPDQVEMLAAMYQIRENASRNRALPHDKRVKMLDEFDGLGRAAGLKTAWINNLRGGLSETLFAPNVGRNKTRLAHPDGGFTILDYSFDPGQRPSSKTGRKEWVEQKSDLITAPDGSTDVFGPAVGRAKRYAMDATSDMKALQATAVTQGDTILIEFVRPPGNDATKTAMLRVLFGESSPIQAVKFADGAWIERADFLAGK